MHSKQDELDNARESWYNDELSDETYYAKIAQIERNHAIANVRQFLDFLEENEDMPIPYHFKFGVSDWIAEYDTETHKLDMEATKAKVRELVKLLPKPVEKNYTNLSLNFVAMFGEFKYTINCSRESVCKRKQVGTKIIEATPARTEPIYEWECEDASILKL